MIYNGMLIITAMLLVHVAGQYNVTVLGWGRSVVALHGTAAPLLYTRCPCRAACSLEVVNTEETAAVAAQNICTKSHSS